MAIANQLILASKSLVREHVLRSTGLVFSITPSNFDEKTIEDHNPKELAFTRALHKAKTVADKKPGALVIGCDQTLSLDSQIFHKPKNKTDALEQLHTLNGKTHYLHSAVVLSFNADDETFILKKLSFVKTIAMHMRQLSAEELYTYIETNEWQGCVGGYRIEGIGVQLFEKDTIADFTAIIGLPVLELLTSLRRLGIHGITKNNPPWDISIDHL